MKRPALHTRAPHPHPRGSVPQARPVLVPLLWLATLASVASGCTPRLLIAPADAPAVAAGEARTALEALGPEVRPEHFHPGGSLMIVGDTSWSAVEVRRMLDRFVPSTGQLALERETRRLFLCPDRVIEVGRARVHRTYPNRTEVDSERGWEGHWVRDDAGGWKLLSARVGGVPRTRRLARPSECVSPAEQGLARRRLALVVHAPVRGPSRGGVLESAADELRFAGWDVGRCEADPDCDGIRSEEGQDIVWLDLGVRARLRGPWGAGVVAGWEEGLVTGYDPGRGDARLTARTTYLAVQAAYELRYLRLATGPAWVAAHWSWEEWSGMTPPSSGSATRLGWLSEVALTLPLASFVYLDVTYQDRLFGSGSMPALGNLEPADQRLSGTALQAGLGVKF